MGALPKVNLSSSLPSGKPSSSNSSKKGSHSIDTIPSELAFLALAVIIIIAVVCGWRFGYFGKIKEFFKKKKKSSLDSDLPSGDNN